MGEAVMMKEQYALNSRVDQLEAVTQANYKGFGELVSSLATDMHRRFNAMDRRFDEMNHRFDSMLDHMNKRFNRLESKVDRIHETVGAMRIEFRVRYDHVGEGLKITENYARRIEDTVIALDGRVEALEKKEVEQAAPAANLCSESPEI